MGILGRPEKLTKANLRAILVRVGNKEPMRAIARDYGVSHTAIYNRLTELQKGGEKLYPDITTPNTAPKRAPVKIPVEVEVKGDTIRAIFLLLAGTSHRGKINDCLTEIQTILGRLDYRPERR